MDPHTKSYVCTHVFSVERLVRYVMRLDGDWCLLCEGGHEDKTSESWALAMS